jgi:hypothetical protein
MQTGKTGQDMQTTKAAFFATRYIHPATAKPRVRQTDCKAEHRAKVRMPMEGQKRDEL